MLQPLLEALGVIFLELSRKHYCLEKKCVKILDEEDKLKESATDP